MDFWLKLGWSGAIIVFAAVGVLGFGAWWGLITAWSPLARLAILAAVGAATLSGGTELLRQMGVSLTGKEKALADINIIGNNNIVSQNQSGGVTAGTYINQAPQPDIRIAGSTEVVEADGSHTRTLKIEVVSPYRPNRLQLEANATEVTGGDLRPGDGRPLLFGHNLTPDRYYVSIDGPSGVYYLIVKTKQHAVINLHYAFD